MLFLVAKQPCELAVKLSEVWIRILINDIASISSDFLINGKYCLSSRKEKRALFLDSWVQFVKCFYFDACKLLYANAFVFVCEKFDQAFMIVQRPWRLLTNVIWIIAQENIAGRYAHENFFVFS